ncbi:MAG: hypothetical protein P8166_02995 [Candidatus Thiodiazotropha sp.]
MSGEKGEDVLGSRGAVGDSGHEVKQGESVPSLMVSLGLNWEAVWNLTENGALREARSGDASALLPGDRVYIPPLVKRPNLSSRISGIASQNGPHPIDSAWRVRGAMAPGLVNPT